MREAPIQHGMQVYRLRHDDALDVTDRCRVELLTTGDDGYRVHADLFAIAPEPVRLREAVQATTRFFCQADVNSHRETPGILEEKSRGLGARPLQYITRTRHRQYPIGELGYVIRTRR